MTVRHPQGVLIHFLSKIFFYDRTDFWLQDIDVVNCEVILRTDPNTNIKGGSNTTQKMKRSIKNFFSKSLMENFIFGAVQIPFSSVFL